MYVDWIQLHPMLTRVVCLFGMGPSIRREAKALLNGAESNSKEPWSGPTAHQLLINTGTIR